QFLGAYGDEGHAVLVRLDLFRNAHNSHDQAHPGLPHSGKGRRMNQGQSRSRGERRGSRGQGRRQPPTILPSLPPRPPPPPPPPLSPLAPRPSPPAPRPSPLAPRHCFCYPQVITPGSKGLARSGWRGSTRTAKPCCPLDRHGIIPWYSQVLPSRWPLVLMATVRGLGMSPRLSTTPWKSCTSTSSGEKLPRLTRAFTCSSPPTRIGSVPLDSTPSIRICGQPRTRCFRHCARTVAFLRLSADSRENRWALGQ